MNTTPIWIRQFCSFARVVKYSIYPSMVVWQNRLYKRQPIREMTMTAINCQKLQVQSLLNTTRHTNENCLLSTAKQGTHLFSFLLFSYFLGLPCVLKLIEKIQSCKSKRQKTNMGTLLHRLVLLSSSSSPPPSVLPAMSPPYVRNMHSTDHMQK